MTMIETTKATSIRIHSDTKERLEKLGNYGDSHSSIIDRLIDAYYEVMKND